MVAIITFLIGAGLGLGMFFLLARIKAKATAEAAAAPAADAAPEQLPVTGADGGTLGALVAALGIAAGGGWVALRRKR